MWGTVRFPVAKKSRMICDPSPLIPLSGNHRRRLTKRFMVRRVNLMTKDPTNVFILNSLNLPIIEDLYTLSDATGISLKMIYLLTEKSEDFYTSIRIPKNNGGFRDIYSPNLSLKLIQRWILEEILYKIQSSSEAIAFKKKLNGPYENAFYHKENLYLLQMDIKDFFPSITREKVYYLFKNLGYNKFTSNVLSNLCTLNGKLPQGGVCSPYLSNLICYKMDHRLRGLCSKRDILYTRYADDLTFSCNNKIALRKLQQIVGKIVNDEGYSLNHTKTRFSSPSSTKKITGVTITSDKKLKADKHIKKKVRAMIHYAIVSGNYEKSNEILGYIGYINSIEKNYVKSIIKYIQKLTEKDFKYFNKIVTAYNNNKFFKSLPDMEQEELEKQLEESSDTEILITDDIVTEFFKHMIEKRKKFFDERELFDQDLEDLYTMFFSDRDDVLEEENLDDEGNLPF